MSKYRITPIAFDDASARGLAKGAVRAVDLP